MREKIFDGVILLLFFASAILAVMFYQNNMELEDQVKERDNLLNDAKQRDSLFIIQSKRYTDTITNYVNNCEFQMNGKVISSAELINFMNKTLDENSRLQGSLITKTTELQTRTELMDKYVAMLQGCIEERNKLRDSSHMYKKIVELVKRDYGIEYSVEQKNGAYLYTKVFSKVDSALLLLPYYRNKLKKEPNSDTWTIIPR